MANQDSKKKQDMGNTQNQTSEKTQKAGNTKEFTSSDRTRESDISKQSGQNVNPEKREEQTKRK